MFTEPGETELLAERRARSGIRATERAQWLAGIGCTKAAPRGVIPGLVRPVS